MPKYRCSGPLPHVPFGVVLPGSSNEVGATRKIVCQPGFEVLRGPDFVYCTLSLQWSKPGNCTLKWTTSTQPASTATWPTTTTTTMTTTTTTRKAVDCSHEPIQSKSSTTCPMSIVVLFFVAISLSFSFSSD